MHLKIVTPERVVLDDATVDGVYVKTTDGEIGILPRHVPLVTPLATGVLYFTRDGKKIPAAVMGGLLRTDGQSVVVLSDKAELGSEVDVVRAEHAKARAEALLNEKTDNVDIDRAELALARAVARLKASSNN